jgi:hypothetical protein
MRVVPIAALVLLGALTACTDSPVAAGADGPSSQRSARNAGSPGDAQAASNSYYSLTAYNGVINGNDQFQLTSVQNAQAGTFFQSLTVTYYIQYGCTGSWVSQGSETYDAYYGNPVGLSGQRTITRPSGEINRVAVSGAHTFQPGSTSTTYFSWAESQCY